MVTSNLKNKPALSKPIVITYQNSLCRYLIILIFFVISTTHYYILWIDPIVTQTCRGTINGPKHTSNHGKTLIKSPNYPKPYPDDVVCRWNITVPCGSDIATEELPGIRIIFDSFHLKTTTDYLDIKEDGRVIRTMQGYKTPAPFISKQKTVE